MAPVCAKWYHLSPNSFCQLLRPPSPAPRPPLTQLSRAGGWPITGAHGARQNWKRESRTLRRSPRPARARCLAVDQTLSSASGPQRRTPPPQPSGPAVIAGRPGIRWNTAPTPPLRMLSLQLQGRRLHSGKGPRGRIGAAPAALGGTKPGPLAPEQDEPNCVPLNSGLL